MERIRSKAVPMRETYKAARVVLLIQQFFQPMSYSTVQGQSAAGILWRNTAINLLVGKVELGMGCYYKGVHCIEASCDYWELSAVHR